MQGERRGPLVPEPPTHQQFLAKQRAVAAAFEGDPMTPEEHYAEAVRLLTRARRGGFRAAIDTALAEAQVHATLAMYRPPSEKPHGTAHHPSAEEAS